MKILGFFLPNTTKCLTNKNIVTLIITYKDPLMVYPGYSFKENYIKQYVSIKDVIVVWQTWARFLKKVQDTSTKLYCKFYFLLQSNKMKKKLKILYIEMLK